MGHAIHFLERLKRIDDGHIEQVLSLYYSSERTQGIINIALNSFLSDEERQAPDTQRVALALDDTDAPPYLIATRSGQMVTCLAPGMQPYGLPIVSGQTLGSACARYDDIKSRSDDYARLHEKYGDQKNPNILKPIFEHNWAVPRSTIRGISFLHPWLDLDAFRRALNIGISLDSQREDLVKFVRRAQTSHDKQRWVGINEDSEMKSRLKQRYDKPLRKYWDDAWAMTHLMMLSVCQNATRVVELMTSNEVMTYIKSLPFIFDPRLIAWSVVRQGSVPLTLRGIWINAQLGDACLDGVEPSIGQHITPLGLLNHLMPACVLAIRETPQRSRALKLLEQASTFDAHDPDAHLNYYRSVAKLLHGIAESPTSIANLSTFAEQDGRDFYDQIAQFGRNNGVYVPCSTADLPREIAITLGSLLPRTAHGPGQGAYDDLVFYLPWLARIKMDDFYLPDEFARLLHIWDPELCANMLLGHATLSPNRFATKPSAPKIGRNDPCSCGSGKKYKTCCLSKNK